MEVALTLIKKIIKIVVLYLFRLDILSLFPNFIIGTYYPNQIGVYLNVPIEPRHNFSQKRIIYTTDG